MMLIDIIEAIEKLAFERLNMDNPNEEAYKIGLIQIQSICAGILVDRGLESNENKQIIRDSLRGK